MRSDEYDYRGAYPGIGLPESGRVPVGCTDETLTVLQLDEHVAALETFCNDIGTLPRRITNQSVALEITADDVARAWRLWMQSHHTFFCEFAVLAYAYDRLIESASKPGSASARQWAENVAALWRGAGALMMYGCDFHPTQMIYCKYIRTKMPEAFSGFWLREWILVRTAMRTWEQVQCDETAFDLRELQSIVKQGLQVYHNYHDHVMRTSVPDGKSLARGYHLVNGCAHPVAEREFAIYDSWFQVERVLQTRWQFVDTACREFSKTIGEIRKSSFLPEGVISDLRIGFRAALGIFGIWLGPIPITSKYYPRTLRGE